MPSTPTGARPDTVRVAIVAARWHADIVGQAVASFRSALAERGVGEVDEYQVPGAFEIPLHTRRLALTGRYDAIATCAFVVDGGIYRHDFVAGTVVDALMRVQLDTDVPVFSAVLTPQAFHEHAEHQEFFARHFQVKGRELADAVVTTIAGLAALPA
ncbi:67-dimethyl-8-ribityllumazine synthase [Parafrankia sp. EAN1pec]|uniref:6,7-dimethyl-8-ribityllumazine synthase n=1 Tax=Parafrankia sp. (strain EAN1pec) TaxID=298653 RepID=UPI000054168C|nr:67-dimethyl-8-ribityllumazine synthase [Frankia sp. EAN1pec]